MKKHFNCHGLRTFSYRLGTSFALIALWVCPTASPQIPETLGQTAWVHIGSLEVQRDFEIIKRDYPPGAAENALREVRDAGFDAIDIEPVLSSILANESRSSLQRRLIAEVFGNFALCNQTPYSASALRSLVRALRSEDDKVAAESAISIGRQKTVDQFVVSALVASVRDETTGTITRREAACALGNLAQFSKISLPALAQMIQRHGSDVDGAEEAITAVQQFGARACPEVPLLSRLVDDSSSQTRIRASALEAVQGIVRCLTNQCRDLRTSELIAAWWHLHAAKHELLNADADLQGNAKRAIDETLRGIRAEAKRRGLVATAIVTATEASLAIISAILAVFFRAHAERMNKLIGQIKTGTELTVPLVNLKVRFPAVRLGKFLQIISFLGLFVKLVSRFPLAESGMEKK